MIAYPWFTQALPSFETSLTINLFSFYVSHDEWRNGLTCLQEWVNNFWVPAILCIDKTYARVLILQHEVDVCLRRIQCTQTVTCLISIILVIIIVSTLVEQEVIFCTVHYTARSRLNLSYDLLSLFEVLVNQTSCNLQLQRVCQLSPFCHVTTVYYILRSQTSLILSCSKYLDIIVKVSQEQIIQVFHLVILRSQSTTETSLSSFSIRNITTEVSIIDTQICRKDIQYCFVLLVSSRLLFIKLAQFILQQVNIVLNIDVLETLLLRTFYYIFCNTTARYSSLQAITEVLCVKEPISIWRWVKFKNRLT